MNIKGQFFSPDLIIAMGVFIFSLALFWTASGAIFEQVELFNSRIDSDEVSHALLNSLVLSSGYPNNWENYSLDDINSFGLIHSSSVLDLNKTVKLIELLNSEDYLSVKYKLGAGKYDLQLRVVNSSGDVLLIPSSLSGGRVADNPVVKSANTRIVYYNGGTVLLEAVLSLKE